MNKIYLLLPFLIGNYLICMEPPENNLPTKQYIIIQDYYGECFQVPTEQALKLSTIKNLLSQEDDDLEFDISFYQKDISNNIFVKKETVADELHTTLLTKELIKKVINFANNKTLNIKDKKEWYDLIFLADFLGAPTEIIKKIIKNLSDYTGYNPRLYCQNYQTYKLLADYQINSIQYCYQNNHEHEKEFLIQKKLNLSYKEDLFSERIGLPKVLKLDTLWGIRHRISQQKKMKKVERIKLNNNNLICLNIKQLLKFFPNLQKLAANNNSIENLILPKKLPTNFKLLLKNNKIQNIENLESFQGEGSCHINLSNNPLTVTAKQNLEKSKQSSFFQRFKKYPFIAKKILSASLYGGLYCGYAGLGFGMTQEFMWRHKILYALYAKFITYYPQLYVGASIYAVSKILQYTGNNLSPEYTSCISYAEKCGTWCALIGIIGNPLRHIFTDYYNNPAKYTTPTIIYDP